MDGADTFEFPRHYKAAKGFIWLMATMGALFVVYSLVAVAVLVATRTGTLFAYVLLVGSLLLVLAACYVAAGRLILELALQDDRTLIVRTRLTERRFELQSVRSIETSSFGGWPRMRCGGRTYYFPLVMDGRYEFLWILKALQPSVKITNC